MRVSVIIPLWNGASVIEACLASVIAHADSHLHEIICVDNASEDASAAIVAERFPQVRLLRQAMNLGFAGGVNAGMDVACGDTFILLNQDCVVLSGWLDAFARAFASHPEYGIAGCTILNADGTVNHAGATIEHPEGFSRHLTEIHGDEPYSVDYVTGAVFAIPRTTWDAIGRFDEGYYPAYFEEADYCYRARRQGLEIGYVPGARVKHLFSSREAERHPFRHAAMQHKMRYRFVCKHFTDEQLTAFFDAELDALEEEPYLNQVVGRLMGARETLHGLPDILMRRRLDLDIPTDMERQVSLRYGFKRVAQRSLAEMQRLSRPRSEDWQAVVDREKSLQAHEYDLLRRIYFRAPTDQTPESKLQRFVRLLIKRPLSFLTGRDYLLLSELNTYHVSRLDAYQTLLQAQQDLIDHSLRLFDLFTDYEAH